MVSEDVVAATIGEEILEKEDDREEESPWSDWWQEGEEPVWVTEESASPSTGTDVEIEGTKHQRNLEGKQGRSGQLKQPSSREAGILGRWQEHLKGNLQEVGRILLSDVLDLKDLLQWWGFFVYFFFEQSVAGSQKTGYFQIISQINLLLYTQ
uniref:Uncharacterized protein n=1 Tax=Sphaerodactylus townsendi TaxID=933632 RepID=A0ACB8EH98_9SAUR